MNRLRRLSFVVTHIVGPLSILAACGVAFFALGRRPEPAKKNSGPPKPTLVEAVPVRLHGDSVVVEVSGVVVPYREIELSSEVSGTILRKDEKLRAGKFVSKGDLLIEFDTQRYDLGVERYMRQREQAVAELSRLDVEEANLQRLIKLAQDTLELQQKEVKRFAALLVRNASSDEEVSDARRGELTAQSEVLRLENQLRDIDARRAALEHTRELAGVQLRAAELDLKHTVIKSPVDGVVVRDFVEERSHVQTGEHLAVIEDTSAAEVRCHLQMDDLYWIWSQRTNDEQLTLVDQRSSARGAYELPATPATVVYRLAGKEYSWQGTLTRQDGFGLEEQTRTVPCRVVVGDPLAVAQRHGKSTTVATDGPPSLMRGMFVTVQIHCQSNRTLLQVPEIGVRPGEKVWIVRNGRLEVRQARVVRIQDRAAIIDGESGDITSGDQIITSPVPNARQGLVVRVDNGGGSKVGQISELTSHDAIPSSAAAGDGR